MLTRYISMKDKLERHTTAKDKPATYAYMLARGAWMRDI